MASMAMCVDASMAPTPETNIPFLRSMERNEISIGLTLGLYSWL